MQNRHTIGKQIILLQLPPAANAFDLQQQASRLFWETVAPALEALFDKYADVEELISIESLQVDLGFLREKDWEHTFPPRVLEGVEAALRQQINTAGSTPGVIRQPMREGHFQQWLHFLEWGYLPWNASPDANDETLQKGVLDTLASETTALEKLRRLLAKNTPAFERLLLQHPEAFLKTLCAVFTARRQEELLIFRQEWTTLIRAWKNKEYPVPPFLTSGTLFGDLEQASFFWRNVLETVILEGQQWEAPALIRSFLERGVQADHRPEWTDFIKQVMTADANIPGTFSSTVEPPKEAFLEKNDAVPVAESAEAAAGLISSNAQPQAADGQVAVTPFEPPKQAFLEKKDAASDAQSAEAAAGLISSNAQSQAVAGQVAVTPFEAPKQAFLEKKDAVSDAESVEAVAGLISSNAQPQAADGQVAVTPFEPAKEAFLEKNDAASDAQSAEAGAGLISSNAQSQAADGQVALISIEPPKEAFLEKNDVASDAQSAEAGAGLISSNAQPQAVAGQVVATPFEPAKEAFLEKKDAASDAQSAEAGAGLISSNAQSQAADGQVALISIEPPKEAFLEKKDAASDAQSAEAGAGQISSNAQPQAVAGQVAATPFEPAKEAFLEKKDAASDAQSAEAGAGLISSNAQPQAVAGQVAATPFEPSLYEQTALQKGAAANPTEQAATDEGRQTGDGGRRTADGGRQSGDGGRRTADELQEDFSASFLSGRGGEVAGKAVEAVLSAFSEEGAAHPSNDFVETPAGGEAVPTESLPGKEAASVASVREGSMQDILPENPAEKPLSDEESIRLSALQKEQRATEMLMKRDGAAEVFSGNVEAETPERAVQEEAGANPVSTSSSVQTGGGVLEESPAADAVEHPGSGEVQHAVLPASGGLNPAATGRKRPPLAVKAGTALFTRFAGMVLLHPYLPAFFKGLGLTEGKEFKDSASQQRAVHLLHYLATKEQDLPEYVLLLPKLLCGLPFEEPMERYLTFSETETEECDNLLRAVIQHWGALGSASPDGLREAFLRREGKLEMRQDGWQLTVERQTIDILLGRLPWVLGIVKLPWMPEILKVEWG